MVWITRFGEVFVPIFVAMSPLTVLPIFLSLFLAAIAVAMLRTGVLNVAVAVQ